MKKVKAIKQNSHFQKLYKKGKTIVSPFYVCYIKRGSKSGVMLGITATKKIGGAVERNRAKRVLRAAVREASCCGLCGWELVLVARGKSVYSKSTDIARRLIFDLKKEGFIKEDKSI